MSSAPIARITKSSTRCTPTPISPCGSITSSAAGNTPTTACALTSPSPTSPHSNSSPAGNSFRERQSVTNLLDEYTVWRGDKTALYDTPVLRLPPLAGGVAHVPVCHEVSSSFHRSFFPHMFTFRRVFRPASGARRSKPRARQCVATGGWRSDGRDGHLRQRGGRRSY